VSCLCVLRGGCASFVRERFVRWYTTSFSPHLLVARNRSEINFEIGIESLYHLSRASSCYAIVLLLEGCRS